MLHPTDEREQMLRLLDARDSELCTEQVALQHKLHDLNNKKQQIDHLVSQLHNYSIDDDEGTDEMAKQIKQIVAMKEQLATLKGKYKLFILRFNQTKKLNQQKLKSNSLL